MNSLDKLNLLFHSLVIFRNLTKNSVLVKFFRMVDSLSEGTIEQISSYSSFVAELFHENYDFSAYIRDRILGDDNFYIVSLAEGRAVQEDLKECLERELEILQEISQINADRIKARMEFDGFLPVWKTSRIDFKEEYNNRINNLATSGYGIYSKFHMFTIRESAITPVLFPDTTRLSQLKRYDDQRKAVIDNTLALLEGKPAANVLLYGDAGTGKSSTVKAIVNEYRDRGLRLIEVKKNQLQDIPVIIDLVSSNCLRFIIFIDDLSFTQNSDDFGALKAALEGSVTARPNNVVIYATSNRRHLIKEKFSERDGDDVHVNETLQEMVSLSERFGLIVNFEKPDKDLYLSIIHDLSRDYQIDLRTEELDMYAERYALLRSGRSPRIARQLIESLVKD